jgi:hypothetical protein
VNEHSGRHNVPLVSSLYAIRVENDLKHWLYFERIISIYLHMRATQLREAEFFLKPHSRSDSQENFASYTSPKVHIMFITQCHFSLSCTRRINLKPLPISLISVLILSSHLLLDLPSALDAFHGLHISSQQTAYLFQTI